MIECITHDMDKDNRRCRRCGKSEATIQGEKLGYHRQRVAEFLGHATAEEVVQSHRDWWFRSSIPCELGTHIANADGNMCVVTGCDVRGDGDYDIRLRLDEQKATVSEFASGALMALQFAGNRKPAITEIPKEKRERRSKLVRIDPQLIVASMNAFRASTVVCLPVLEGLPEDAEVVNVWYSDERRCFTAEVQHESFDPVPDGWFAPEIDEFVSGKVLRRVSLTEPFSEAK